LLFLLVYEFKDCGKFFGVEEKVGDHLAIPGYLFTHCKNIKSSTLCLQMKLDPTQKYSKIPGTRHFGCQLQELVLHFIFIQQLFIANFCHRYRFI
jgi:hypothetical protein